MALKVHMRLLENDGTPEGQVLQTFEDVTYDVIPPEATKLRVSNREGLYRVLPDGILYYYMATELRITVVVERIDVSIEEE